MGDARANALTGPERALAALAALDVLEAAATGGTMEHSATLAREMARLVLEDLTDEQQASLVATLATMAVYELPRPVQGRAALLRLAEIRTWLPNVRLEWTWSAS